MRIHTHPYRPFPEREHRLLAFAEIPNLNAGELQDMKGLLKPEEQKKESTELPETEDQRLERLVDETNRVTGEFGGRVKDLPQDIGDKLHSELVDYLRRAAQTAERNGIAGLSMEEFDGLRREVEQSVRDVMQAIAGGAEDSKNDAEQKQQESDRKARSIETVQSHMEARAIESAHIERVDAAALRDKEHPERMQEEVDKFQRSEQKMQALHTEILKLGTDITDYHAKANEQIKALYEPSTRTTGIACTIGFFFGGPAGAQIGYTVGRAVNFFGSRGEGERKAAEYNRTLDASRSRFRTSQGQAERAAQDIDADGILLGRAPEQLGKYQKETYEARRKDIDARKNETAQEREAREKRAVEVAASRKALEKHAEDLEARREYLAQSQAEVEEGKQGLGIQRTELEGNASQIDVAISQLEQATTQLEQGTPDDPRLPQLREKLGQLQQARDQGHHGLAEIAGAQQQMEQVSQETQQQHADTEEFAVDLQAHDASLGDTLDMLRETIPLLKNHEEDLGKTAADMEKELQAQLETTGKIGNTVSREVLRANVLNAKSANEIHATGNRIDVLPSVETPSFMDTVVSGTFEAYGRLAKFVFCETIGKGLEKTSKFFKDLTKNIPVLHELTHIVFFNMDVVAGVVEGVGELCEGITTLLAHPLTTLNGMGALIGRDPQTGEWSWNTSGKAWKEMGKAIIAFKEFSEGDIGKGTGKVALNVVLTFFTGGAGTAAKGVSAAGIAFRLATAEGANVVRAGLKAGVTGLRVGGGELLHGIAKAPGKVIEVGGNILKAPSKIVTSFKLDKATKLERAIAGDTEALAKVTGKLDEVTIGGRKISEIPELAGKSADDLKKLTPEDLQKIGVKNDPQSIAEFLNAQKMIGQAEKLQKSLASSAHALDALEARRAASAAERAAKTDAPPVPDLSDVTKRGMASADQKLADIQKKIDGGGLDADGLKKLQKQQKDILDLRTTLEGIQNGTVRLDGAGVNAYRGLRDAGDKLGLNIADQQALAQGVLKNAGVSIENMLTLERYLGSPRTLGLAERASLEAPLGTLSRESALGKRLADVERVMNGPRPLERMRRLVDSLPPGPEKTMLRELYKDLEAMKGLPIDDIEKAMILRESMEYLRDYQAALREGGGKISGSTAGTVREAFDLMRENQRKLAHQTIADRFYLTGSDHGVGHVLGNDMRLADQIATELMGMKPPRMTAKERLLMRQVIIEHDMGYTMQSLEKFLDESGASLDAYRAMTKDHPLYSGVRFDKNCAMLEHYFGKDGFNDMRMAVLDHSNVKNKKGMGPGVTGGDLIGDIVAKVDCLHVVAGDALTGSARLSGKAMKVFTDPEMMASLGRSFDISKELGKYAKGTPEHTKLLSEMSTIKNNMKEMVQQRYAGTALEKPYMNALERFFDPHDPVFAAKRDFGASGIGMRGVKVAPDGTLTATFEINPAFHQIKELYGEGVALKGLEKAVDDFGVVLSPDDIAKIKALPEGGTVTIPGKYGSKFEVHRPLPGKEASDVTRLNRVLDREKNLRQTIERLKLNDADAASAALGKCRDTFTDHTLAKPFMETPTSPLRTPEALLEKAQRLIDIGTPEALASAQRMLEHLRANGRGKLHTPPLGKAA